MSQRQAFSVSVFARHAGRLLLIRHKRLGTWLPVGGELHEGETPLEAARRELVEETGLVGRFEALLGVDGTPPGLLGYEEHQAGSKGRHLNFCFVADVDTSAVTANHEFDEHRWVADPSEVDCPRNVVELGRMALHACGRPLIALARRWLDCFNRADLEGLLALYDDEVVHTSPKLRARQPETKGEVRGKAALRAWFADSMQRLPKLHYQERHLTATADRVVMEYLRLNPGDEPLEVAEVLECKGGRIVASYVFHG